MLPHWTQGDVMVDGSRLHYYRTGAGEKPPLVLAHGFSDSGLCWLPVARDLEAEFDVILVDARGHGLSERVQLGDKTDLAGDLAAVIGGLGLNHPVVGGHSMGGSTSGALGARFPELPRALILEDPAWFMPKEPVEPISGAQREESDYDRFLKTAHSLPLEDIIARCRANDPKWSEIEVEPWALSKQQYDPNFSMARGARGDWQEEAARIQVPVLLITAQPDQGSIVTEETAQRAQSLNPLIQVVNIANAGHNIRRDNYQDYMQAVWAFLHSLS